MTRDGAKKTLSITGLEMATTGVPSHNGDARNRGRGRSVLHGLPSWVRLAQPARVNVRDQKQWKRGGFATVAGFVTVWDDANDRPGYSRESLRQLRADRGVGPVRRVDFSGRGR